MPLKKKKSSAFIYKIKLKVYTASLYRYGCLHYERSPLKARSAFLHTRYRTNFFVALTFLCVNSLFLVVFSIISVLLHRSQFICNRQYQPKILIIWNQIPGFSVNNPCDKGRRHRLTFHIWKTFFIELIIQRK